MNEIEKQIGAGIDKAYKKLVVDTMVNHAAQSQTRAAQIQTTMTNPNNYSLGICKNLRSDISEVAKNISVLRQIPLDIASHPETVGEFFSNVTLALRHLEDAQSRLGRAINTLNK